MMKKLLLTAIISSFSLIAHSADFSGKTIEWIIPFKAGGGSDKWSRFYAPLLAKELPGNPNVVVKNMPGGGSTKGANFFANRVRGDGMTIFGSSGSTQFPFLLGDRRVRYNYADWQIVLGSSTGGVVYISPELGIKNPRDIAKLKNIKLKYGSQGATSLDLIPLLAFDMLGLNVDAVFGMQGRKAGRLAFLRGETNIDYQTSSSYLKNVLPNVEKGEAVPLFSWGALDLNGNLIRDPAFPNLPHFAEVYELINGQKPSGQAFEAWKVFFAAGFPAQKMVFLPNDASRDVVNTYKNAFARVVNQPDFKSKSEKILGDYPQYVGDAAQDVKKIATTVTPSAKSWVRNWLSEKYGTKF